MRLSSYELLKELGVDFEYFCEEGSEPKRTSIKFSDLVPELIHGGERSRLIASQYLYEHQLRCLEALREGKNVILRSGTGSGKTEAWVMYALMSRSRVLAVYPTLALSADQIVRIYDYYSALGLKDRVIKVDRPSINLLSGISIRSSIEKAYVVITNPAFLMSDIKRIAENPRKSYLLPFIRNVDIVIIDELDFYGSKGASLLISLIELIANYISRKKPQVIILTATLGNPEELKEVLSRITGRETVIIDGIPFKIRNCTYLVFGKDLEKIREEVLRIITTYFSSNSELLDIVSNPILFRRNASTIIEYLRKQGFRVPDIYLDPAEIIARYVDDDYVTLVFTPSIKSAEKLARRIKELLPPEKRELIALHHHLIPKKVRELIENMARSTPPKVKVIITVRTLLQGIDIWSIARIVHYGLPEEVREYLQREGRKGRRKELLFTESIIIPITSWDRSIISLGALGIKEFTELPLEKVYVLSNNKYVILFKALYKVVAGIPLTKEEKELLEGFKLIEEVPSLSGKVIRLNSQGVRVWNFMNFYEYGPPYGVRRFVSKQGKLYEVEPISRRDLIEKYQPGCIDYGEESIILEASYAKVIEQPVTDIGGISSTYSFINEVLDTYEAVKIRWGERPDLAKDVVRGKVSSIVKLSIKLPMNGFGTYYEVPIGVKWVIESSRRLRLIRIGDTLVPHYEEEVVDVNVGTSGIYQDFTYGYVYELSPDEDTSLLKVAIATLRVVLRLLPKYAISFRELMIALDPTPLPPPKVLLWELEASGITERIDWLEIADEVMKLKEPPKLWIQLLRLVDREAAAIAIAKNIDWGIIKEHVIRLLRIFSKSLEVKIKDVVTTISKPSRELKLLSLEIISAKLNDEYAYAIGTFDGEKVGSRYLICREAICDDVEDQLLSIFRYVAQNNLRILTSSEELLSQISSSGILSWVYEKALIGGIIVNPYRYIRNLGLEITITDLRSSLGIELPDSTMIMDFIRKGKNVSWLMRRYVEGLAKLTYYAYLIYESLRRSHNR